MRKERTEKREQEREKRRNGNEIEERVKGSKKLGESS